MRSFGPEQLSLDRMKFVQQEHAAPYRELAHHREKTVEVLMIMENSKLKHEYIEVVSPT